MKIFQKLGIDLGTNNTLIWQAGEGIVVEEPTVVAVEAETGAVLAAGSEAKKMLGKTPVNIDIVRPFKDGVICDFGVTEAMLKYFLRQAAGRWWFLGPEVVLALPAQISGVEKRAVAEAVLGAGARKAHFIDKPLAAAIGTKIPVAESSGNMMVDIGGGSTEAAVVAVGGVVASKSQKTGGSRLDALIMEKVKKEHNLVIGEGTAENLKIKLGSAIKLKRPESMEVNGRDSISGLPKTVTVSSDEVYEAVRPGLEVVLETIKGTVEAISPELVADISDRGIVLCGGQAMLRNINILVTREIGVSAHVAIEPRLAVIKGLGVVVENWAEYSQIIRQL